MTQYKIHSLEKLVPVIEGHRQAGQTIVFANGCFDLVHVGHIRYLQGARALGDLLVVGLNSDDSVRNLKGTGRSLMPEKERSEIVAELSCVDYLVVFNEPTVEHLLQALRPDIHCKGSDYTEDTVPERKVVLSYGGRVAIVGDPKDHSTRDLIKKIIQNFCG